MNSICPKCKAEIPETNVNPQTGIALCASCGEVFNLAALNPPPVAAMPHSAGRFCLQCGAKLGEGLKFCTRCGNPIQLQAEYRLQIPITSLKLYKPFKVLAIIAPIFYLAYILIAIFVYDFEGAFSYYSYYDVSYIEWMLGILLYGFSFTYLIIKLKMAFHQRKYGVIVFSIINTLFCIIAVCVTFTELGALGEFGDFFCDFYLIFAFILSIFELVWATGKK